MFQAHCLFRHLPEFVRQTEPLGLGLWSEQTPEAVHHDFARKWADYRVKDIDNPLYATRLLSAVRTTYNIQHTTVRICNSLSRFVLSVFLSVCTSICVRLPVVCISLSLSLLLSPFCLGLSYDVPFHHLLVHRPYYYHFSSYYHWYHLFPYLHLCW